MSVNVRRTPASATSVDYQNEKNMESVPWIILFAFIELKTILGVSRRLRQFWSGFFNFYHGKSDYCHTPEKMHHFLLIYLKDEDMRLDLIVPVSRHRKINRNLPDLVKSCYTQSIPDEFVRLKRRDFRSVARARCIQLYATPQLLRSQEQ